MFQTNLSTDFRSLPRRVCIRKIAPSFEPHSNDTLTIPDNVSDASTADNQNDWLFDSYGEPVVSENASTSITIPMRRSSENCLEDMSPTTTIQSPSYHSAFKLSESQTRTKSLPDLFDSTIAELEKHLPVSPRFQSLQRQSVSSKPDLEGEMMVNIEGTFEKRWCAIYHDRFIIYTSFKDRTKLITFHLNTDSKIYPTDDKAGIDELFTFKLVTTQVSVVCGVDTVLTMLRWVNQLTKSSKFFAQKADDGGSHERHKDLVNKLIQMTECGGI
ncbi:hypothetical protein HDV02_002182 [Globomyces sp. JEL0801]|nr:hypothetical protein HDV02_002182 [Globomyces sp. JEL0801]